MSAQEPLRLIGNPEENFYVLGKKHQQHYKIFRQQLLGSPSLSSQLESLTKKVRKAETVELPQNFWGSLLKAYCDGLEVPLKDYLAFIHAMEASVLICGSSSTFVWDKSLQTTHFLRIINWPLHLGHELELIYLQIPHQNSLFIQTIKGLPFLPLTMMNSYGLSLGVHRKFSPLEHPEGVEIGQIALETMINSRDVFQARKFLKGKQTLHHWGLVFLDSSHELLAMDMAGPQVDVIQTTMGPEQVIFFNSAPLVKNKSVTESEPPYFSELCRLEREWTLSEFKNKQDHFLSHLTRLPKTYPTKNCALRTHSVGAMQLTPTNQSVELNTGDYPAWNQGETITYLNLFEQHMRKTEKSKAPLTSSQLKIWQTHRHYSLAQKCYDEADFTAAFHHLQMGLASADKNLKSQGLWVLAFWKWHHLKGVRLRLLEYRELTQNEKSIHLSHHPHLKLLKLFYEMELSLSATVTSVDLGEKLKDIADKVLMGQASERSAYAKKIQARLDFQDLIILD